MRGFTLIEILLTLAAIGIIAGMSLPIYQSLQVRNDLDIAATSLAQSLRRAQTLSQAADGDTTWGVHIQTGDVTVFKGSTYAGRDSSYDETFAVPTSITPTGLSEIVFTKLTGIPQNTGTTTFTSNANEIRTVTINAKGMVNY